MPDTSSSDPSAGAREAVDRWLQPVGDAPCGEDLEYDLAFLELSLAAAGKPETQFSPAEPPSWAEVRTHAEGLLERTRDLRVGVLWVRSAIGLNGLAGLAEGLRLLNGWLDVFWDGLHPALDPDDGDAFARISVLGTLIDLSGLLGDVRQSLLAADRRLGGLRVRDIEVALDRLPARADESPRSLRQIEGMLADLPEVAAQLRGVCEAALRGVADLQRLMNDRFGIDRAVDLKPLRAMLDAVRGVLPEPDAAGDAAGAAGDADAQADADDPDAGASVAPSGGGAASKRRRGGGMDAIESRQDAIKAIDAICGYLERSEPTNPAQLLLRRAQRLIDKNFLQLVRDLAPDAVAEVARIMGVDPESITSDADS